MKFKSFIFVKIICFIPLIVSANCYEAKLSAKDNYNRCLKDAELGNAMAQYFIGQMYRKGDGVEENLEQALHWYKKAAEQGNRPALYNLGWMYDSGEGVPKDLNKALRWYEKAARLGDPYAPFNIGAIYYSGRDLPKDFTQALFWFDVAILNGNKKGQKWRAKLVEKLSPPQIEESADRLEVWKASNANSAK